MKNYVSVYITSLTPCIPNDIRSQLNGTDVLVYESIFTAANEHSLQNPSGSVYTLISERGIGLRIGRHRVTVSRAICKLHRLGLIHRQRRRPVNGSFLTNMYHLGFYFYRSINKLSTYLALKFKRVAEPLLKVINSKGTNYFKGKNTVNNRSPDNQDYKVTLERLKENAQKIGRWEATTT